MDIWELLTAVLSGLAVCIPLVVKLCGYVRMAVQAKSYGALLSLVMGLMEQAEESFASGAERKQWVVDMAMSAAKGIGYDVQRGELEGLVDALCEMSKKVNAGKKAETV